MAGPRDGAEGLVRCHGITEETFSHGGDLWCRGTCDRARRAPAGRRDTRRAASRAVAFPRKRSATETTSGDVALARPAGAPRARGRTPGRAEGLSRCRGVAAETFSHGGDLWCRGACDRARRAPAGRRDTRRAASRAVAFPRKRSPRRRRLVTWPLRAQQERRGRVAGPRGARRASRGAVALPRKRSPRRRRLVTWDLRAQQERRGRVAGPRGARRASRGAVALPRKRSPRRRRLVTWDLRAQQERRGRVAGPRGARRAS